ncbi:Aminobenzoyl-glutamate transport protein [Corynebacterium pseudotuberculosis]|uniref:AbgT family transporter n=1 Tax=Corynebacterium pseudotuberculosis TaxID=1719 RepID=UPI000B429EA8|nr:AbgT family transporter [Corynebacterium pseudotuberculosis]AKP08243.2 Aminobenzoyl-glutamate transport protein [Corynebacterium pseudotuberculosis]
MSTTSEQTLENKNDAPPKSQGFLGFVERAGNVLPDPFWLFVILAGLVAISSWLGSKAGMIAINPQDNSPVAVTNLLTKDGISKMLTEAVNNFVAFPPLRVILTVMLGVAVAEHSGFISALIRAMVAKVGPRTLTFVVALAGVTGSIASDAVYVILIPLGAMSFRALGRSPIVGAMVAFAASSAGFNASLILNITDVLLGGISTSAAQLVDPDYHVSPLANYFFVVASSIVLALIITLVTELFIKKKARELVDHDRIDHSALTFSNNAGGSPGAQPHREETDDELAQEIELHPSEARALACAGGAFVLMLAAYFALLFVPFSPLYSAEGALSSPLIKAIAVPIAMMFLGLGIVYGVAAKTITKLGDIPEFMGRGLKTLIPMIVLFFMVAQFLAWFQWSNLGMWTAIKGAELLQQWDLPVYVLFGALVVMVAALNLAITSGSAQWALMAPVIVPMMMYIGVSPEVSQMLFRIGDSPTNIITPMSPYFALALTFLQRYYKPAGVGTLMSLALPYSISMLVGWFLFFVVWYFLGIPIGPGTPIHYG